MVGERHPATAAHQRAPSQIAVPEDTVPCQLQNRYGSAKPVPWGKQWFYCNFGFAELPCPWQGQSSAWDSCPAQIPLIWMACFGTTASDISLRGYARPPQALVLQQPTGGGCGGGMSEPPLLTKVQKGNRGCLWAFSALARQGKVHSTSKDTGQSLAAGAACTAPPPGQASHPHPSIAHPSDPPRAPSPPCYSPPRSWEHTPPAWPWSQGLPAPCSPRLSSLHLVGLPALSCPTAEQKRSSTQAVASSPGQGFSLTASISSQQSERVLDKQHSTVPSACGAAQGTRALPACQGQPYNANYPPAPIKC